MEEKLTHEQKLEKRRCYFQGDVITSIEELVKYDFVYCRGKIYQKGWVLSWQLKMVLDYLCKGFFRYAHKKQGCKTYMEKKLEKQFKTKNLYKPILKPYTLEDVKRYFGDNYEKYENTLLGL